MLINQLFVVLRAMQEFRKNKQNDNQVNIKHKYKN